MKALPAASTPTRGTESCSTKGLILLLHPQGCVTWSDAPIWSQVCRHPRALSSSDTRPVNIWSCILDLRMQRSQWRSVNQASNELTNGLSYGSAEVTVVMLDRAGDCPRSWTSYYIICSNEGCSYKQHICTILTRVTESDRLTHLQFVDFGIQCKGK